MPKNKRPSSQKKAPQARIHEDTSSRQLHSDLIETDSEGSASEDESSPLRDRAPLLPPRDNAQARTRLPLLMTEDVERPANQRALARTQGGPRDNAGQGNRSDRRPLPADPDRLQTLVRALDSQVAEVIDESARLSDGQIHLVEGIRGQLHALERLRRQVEQIERQIEATLPPVFPLDTLIPFQSPFNPPSQQTESELLERSGSYHDRRSDSSAAQNLHDRLEQGLRPASQLNTKLQAVSGDQKVALVVSVNVFPPTRNNPANAAHFAATNQAGGAIPIAIEQSGDSGKLDRDVIEQRARDSAVLIIDPAKLSVEDQDNVQRHSEGGGGELGLSQVPASAIVAVLVPASMDRQQLNRPTHYVGAIESQVYYAGTKQLVTIQHPDYETSLRALFAANPNKTLVVHTTRLGTPTPL